MNNVESGNILDLNPGDVVIIEESHLLFSNLDYTEYNKKTFVIVDRITALGVEFKRLGGTYFVKNWTEVYEQFAHYDAKKLSPKEGKLAKLLLFR